MTAGAAAQAAEVRKHTANGQRCTNLGWSCIPLAVELYGAWGREAQMCFTLLAAQLAGCSHFKQQVKDDFRSVQLTEPGSD